MSTDATTTRHSAHPKTVEQLLPAARELPPGPDGLPSRNSLKNALGIGAPKAREIRSMLARERGVVDSPERSPWTVEQIQDALGVDRERAERIHGVFEGQDPWAYSKPVISDDESDRVSSGDWSAITAELEKIEKDSTAVVTAVVDAPTGSSQTRAPQAVELDPAEVPGESVDDPSEQPAVRVDPGTITPPAVAGGAVSWWQKRRQEKAERTQATDPGTTPARRVRPVVVWPVWLLMIPAFVAVWAGWVGLGQYTGFGRVNLLPGIVEEGGFATIDSAITLPIGMEVFAAYALYVWMSGRVPRRARIFAMVAALTALSLGALGQIAYHLLAAPAGGAPWQITTAVACLPVAVLGLGAALAHLVRADQH